MIIEVQEDKEDKDSARGFQDQKMTRENKKLIEISVSDPNFANDLAFNRQSREV